MTNPLLFKESPITWLILATSIPLAIIIMFIDNPILFIIAFILSICNVIILLKSISSIKFRVKINKHLENCDVDYCISLNENILKKRSINKKKNRNVKIEALFYLFYGYLIQNNLSKAKEVLQQLEENYASKYFTKKADLLYTINKCEYYIATKQFDTAHILLNEIKTILDSKSYKIYKKSYYESYFSLKYRLNIAEKNDYYGADLFYSQLFYKSSSMIGKVSSSTRLGQVYLHNGEIEKAKKAFLFASENGNNTYYAKTAKEALEQIKSSENKNNEIEILS